MKKLLILCFIVSAVYINIYASSTNYSYEELTSDTFAELQTQISDKTLVNEEDGATFDSTITFSATLAVTNTATVGSLSLTTTFYGGSGAYFTNSSGDHWIFYNTAGDTMLDIFDGRMLAYSTNAVTRFSAYHYSTTITDLPEFQLIKSHSDTNLVLDSTVTGEMLGAIRWKGVNGSATGYNEGADIIVTQTASSGTYVPAEIAFTTWSASTNNHHCFVIDDDGGLFATSLNSDTGTALVLNGSNEICTDSSSEKYKKNIRDVDITTEDILSLVPRRYETKSSSTTSLGLIAEEVAAVIPDLVVYRTKELQIVAIDHKKDDGSTEKRMAKKLVDVAPYPDAISYDRLTVLLLQVVKEQQIQIDGLEKRVEALEKK